MKSRRILVWFGILLAAIIFVVALLAVALYFMGNSRLNSTQNVVVPPIEVIADEEIIRRGARLATLSSCGDCHGETYGGEVMIESGFIGYLPAPNLTSGAGGVGAYYTDEDWSRAIRHGIAPDGRPLLIMPSYHYDAYGDDDLAALIAYLQSLPPVNNDVGERSIAFPGTIVFGVFGFDDVAGFTKIDHANVGGNAPEAAPTSEYGEYLVSITACAGCHGSDLRGATDPNAPTGPDISRDGGLAGWTLEDFSLAIRSGTRPDGRQLSTEMPWPAYSLFSDTDVEAIWIYLDEQAQ